LRITNLGETLTSESRLLNELLDPASEAIQSYSVRYLQAFDQVVTSTEQVRFNLRELNRHPQYQTLAALEGVPQLASGAATTLSDLFDATTNSSDLFPAQVTRSSVERDLVNWPQPAACPLTLQNAGDWISVAESCLKEALAGLHNALLDKATLLFSDALRSRLAQGKAEGFIDALLNARTSQELADTLVEHFSNKPTDVVEQKLDLLRRYLQRITVRKVRLSEFQPGKHTLEQSDVEQVVGEFHRFLAKSFHSDAADEYIIVEIE